MKKSEEPCGVKFIIFYPVDQDFSYSVILCRGMHNHPPPPPFSTTEHLDSTVQQLIGGTTEFDDRVSAKQRFAALALMRSRSLAVHPSLVGRSRVGLHTVPRPPPPWNASRPH